MFGTNLQAYFHNPRKTLRQLLQEKIDYTTREYHQCKSDEANADLKRSHARDRGDACLREIERMGDELQNLPLVAKPLRWWERLSGRRGADVQAVADTSQPSVQAQMTTSLQTNSITGRFPSDTHSIPEAMVTDSGRPAGVHVVTAGDGAGDSGMDTGDARGTNGQSRDRHITHPEEFHANELLRRTRAG